MFNAPIPGQSLTTKPKNTPFENPPKFAEPDKALAMHMQHLSDDTRMDAAMQLIEKGMDVQSLTEGILRGAVAQGLHSIDVSLIIAPVLHEYIKTTAKSLKIDFKEGKDFDRPDDDEVQRKAGKAMALKRLALDKGLPEVPQEEPEVEEEMIVEEAPRGLMARR